MLLLFRVTAILEGLSYLALFGFTMPLKYWAGLGAPNQVVGYIHGILFILYGVVALVFCWKHQWGIQRFIRLCIASLLPFGTFYADKKYLSPLA